MDGSVSVKDEGGQRELVFKERFQKKLPMRLFFCCSITYVAREKGVRYSLD